MSKRSYSTMSGGISGPRKKRKTSDEDDYIAKELAVARQHDWSKNKLIPSGAPSGLYNISVNNSEKKFMDTTLGTGHNGKLTLLDDGTVQYFLLNGIKLGTSAFQRIGNKIAMKSLYWSMAFGLNADDTNPTVTLNTASVPVRFMIVYDKQSNGAAFTAADLLSNVVGVDNTTSRPLDVNSANNLNNRDRFIVICDKRFVLQSGGPNARFFKKFKFLNTAACYKSGATVGDITDITSGSIYALAYTDGEMGGDNSDPTIGVRMQGLIRLRYEDS